MIFILIADIKGKVALNGKEDFLTSCVFSAFNYLTEVYFQQFINGAKNILGEGPNLQICSPEYIFWPCYRNPSEFGYGAEPDVVVFTMEHAIVIEAKDNSPKSGVGFDFDEEKNISILRDQLAREYFVGMKRIVGSSYVTDNRCQIINDFILLFVTRDYYFPKIIIEESINAIEEVMPGEGNKAKQRIFWSSWYTVPPVFEKLSAGIEASKIERLITSELLQVLEKRNLRIFSGFTFLDMYEEKISFNDYVFYQKQVRPYFWNELELISNINSSDTCFYTSLQSKSERLFGVNYCG